ncbi:glutaredoxin 2 [Affinibrenneria salicis]|uniref:Glutaredoxin 2 n=1 Tax=Affinibrenneria salicis TaxID=2590031 RepID=A0A5J5G422_9GAMM|nr:glutaredoxin 2 [Affinibrenneria salicis]KAA9001662.1 glutaredoxin 2 [Affinibrenneria salicis]
MKLYIYDHCPFCIKARMIFGLKNIPVELKVLLNDDEATPTAMVGKKMVPILQKDDGSVMPESMDIVHYIDQLDGQPLLTGPQNPAIAAWLKKVTEFANQLVIPRMAHAAFEEFATPGARQYFTEKKQASYGDFTELLGHSEGLIRKLNSELSGLDALIAQPGACNGELSTDDIHLFPLLRSLTLVNGISWPSRVAAYRDTMAKLSQITLLTHMAQ